MRTLRRTLARLLRRAQPDPKPHVFAPGEIARVTSAAGHGHDLYHHLKVGSTCTVLRGLSQGDYYCCGEWEGGSMLEQYVPADCLEPIR